MPIRRNVSCRSVLGQRQRARLGLDDLGGDVVDVAARVAVLRRGLALRGGDQGPDEPVDLRAGVVEVVLAGDLAALRGQDPAERVADRGPAGAAEVDRAGRVRRDELEVDLGPGQRVPAAVRGAGVEHLAHDVALRGRGEPEVEEAGTRDLGRGDAVVRRDGFGERLGEFARASGRPSWPPGGPGSSRSRRGRGCAGVRWSPAPAARRRRCRVRSSTCTAELRTRSARAAGVTPRILGVPWWDARIGLGHITACGEHVRR